LSSQKPVLRIKILIDVVVAADNTQAVFASLECTKMISAEIRFRIAASRPSMEKKMVTAAELFDDSVDNGGIFSTRMLTPAEDLLVTELDIVSSSRTGQESTTPGGERNDGDDRRRDDGVIIAVDATKFLSKTLSGDNGEEHFGFETFA
jgi:hypothetical protein